MKENRRCERKSQRAAEASKSLYERAEEPGWLTLGLRVPRNAAYRIADGTKLGGNAIGRDESSFSPTTKQFSGLFLVSRTLEKVAAIPRREDLGLQHGCLVDSLLYVVSGLRYRQVFHAAGVISVYSRPYIGGVYGLLSNNWRWTQLQSRNITKLSSHKLLHLQLQSQIPVRSWTSSKRFTDTRLCRIV